MVTKPRTLWTFYVAMACLAALITVIGFSRRYFLPLAAGTFDGPAIVHVHGIITFAWIAFMILQAGMVATGRTSTHRSLGMAGIALGTLLVFTATEIAILILARDLKQGGPSPREFVATLLSIILLIAGLFGFAIAHVKTPETHKRLMILATFVILTPALARIVQMIGPSLTRLTRLDLACLASDALILIPIIHDVRTRGKPHPAYVFGGAFILTVQALNLVVRTTPAWYAFTDFLARLVGSG